MKWFGKKQPDTVIGVDVGASAIKLVELAHEKGRSRLMTYGKANWPLTEGSAFDDPKKSGRLLAELIKRSGVVGKKAVASLPVSEVFSAVIAIPEPQNEVEARPLIEAQVQKLVSLPLEELSLSSTFIDKVRKESVLKKEVGKKKGRQEEKTANEQMLEAVKRAPKKQKNVRVLFTAAPKALINKYKELFASAHLELSSLDIESFGLIRSLVGKDRSTMLLIDVGASRTNLTIVKETIPFYTRSVQVGGNQLTRRLSEVLGVGAAEAEQLKHDLSYATDTGVGAQVLETIFGQLVHESQYVFEQYKRQEFAGGEPVEKVVLTGGSSQIPGLRELLTDKLNLNTYLGDPWARVVFPEDVRSMLEEDGPSLSIAVGLAMRD